MSDTSPLSDAEEAVARDGIDAARTSVRDAHPGLGRVLDLEAHHLRGWSPSTEPSLFAQQVLTRANALGADDLVSAACRRVRDRKQVALGQYWRTQPPSRSLLRTLTWNIAVADLAFSPDGTLYAVSAVGLVAWDPSTGRQLTTPPQLAGEASDRLPQRLAVSPDGSLIALAYEDGDIRIVDRASGQVRATLGGHRDRISRLRFLLDGSNRLVSSGRDRAVRLWSTTDGALLHTFEGHTWWVEALAVTRDGNTVVSGSHDSTLRVWDTRTRRCRQVVEALDRTSWVLGATFTDGDRALVTCLEHGQVLRYEFRDGLVRDGRSARPERPGSLGPGIAWGVADIGGGRVLVSNDDAVVDLWATDRGGLSHETSFTGHSGHARVVAVDRSRTVAASVDDHGLVLVWDLAGPPDPRPPLGFYFDVETVAIGGSPMLVAAAPQQHRLIVVRDAMTGKERWRVHDPDEVGPTAMWFGGGALLAAHGHTLRRYSAWDGTPLPAVQMEGNVLCGHAAGAVTVGMRYGDHGRSRVAISLTDVRTGRHARGVLLPDGADYPGRAAVSPDLATVVVPDTGTMRAWRTATDEVVSVELPTTPATDRDRERPADLYGIAVDDEGCHAIGAATDGRAHIWEIGTGGLTSRSTGTHQLRAAAGLAGHRAVTVGLSLNPPVVRGGAAWER
jgi:WD40 repeat protein